MRHFFGISCEEIAHFGDFRDRGWGDGTFSDVLKRQNMSGFYFTSIPLVNTAHNRFDDDLFVK